MGLMDDLERAKEQLKNQEGLPDQPPLVLGAAQFNALYESARRVEKERDTYKERSNHWFNRYHAVAYYANEQRLALKSAKQTVKAWHGEVAWGEYQASPEMRIINRAIDLKTFAGDEIVKTLLGLEKACRLDERLVIVQKLEKLDELRKGE